ncbi:MAG: TonB-dependent siderophore receptor [Burkholderiaceae bacterium]
MKRIAVPSALTALVLLAPHGLLHAQQASASNQSPIDKVQITATRFGEQVQEVPLSMVVVSGQDLRARGASDLRTALSLVGGVRVAAGGDAGPAGAIPGLRGLREPDDFLLLVDGIPAGGVFIPQFETVSLNNVERIEVIRGAAPIYFGTTAFAGTVNVIHYPAGKAASALTLSYGSFGTASLQGSTVLSEGEVKQSLSAEVDTHPGSDPRAGFKRLASTYRLAMPLAGGQARVDVKTLVLRQKPASPTPLDGATGRLTADLPVDFNQNPSDARLDTNRFQLVLGYERPTDLGKWGTTISMARSNVASTRGFLIDDFRSASGNNAVGAIQSRTLDDVFIDTHITANPAPWLSLTYGINELYGHARQNSAGFEYSVPLDGGAPPSSSAGDFTDGESLRDRRNFLGVYGQSRIRVSDRASLLAGLRWNHTRENRTGSDSQASVNQAQTNSRWSGSLGAVLKVWQDVEGDLDDVTLHASIGHTFQPPQIDFGPDAARSVILKPETQRSLQMGVKADGLDGRLSVDLSGFISDFANQAVSAQEGGQPVLINGGSQRVTGFEIESSYRLRQALNLTVHTSHTDARYRNFSTLVDGAMTQLAGNTLPLTSRWLAGAGIVYARPLGWQGSLVASYTGRRFLDRGNTFAASGYTTFDALLGYGFAGYTLSLSGTNLSNRRDAVVASEIGEGQFYRMPARRITANLTIALK